METLYIAIISVCISTANCNKVEGFVRYISEPFAIENILLKRQQDFMPICAEQIEILKSNLTEEQRQRATSTLCVQKGTWDEAHPDSDSE